MLKKSFFLRHLGMSIRDFRKKKGLSQDELAIIMGIHRTYIGSIERGERNPSLFKLYEFSKALNIQMSDLLSVIEFVDTCDM